MSSAARPVLGWRTWRYPFESNAHDGGIKLGRGGEVFPLEGPAVAHCHPSDMDIKWPTSVHGRPDHRYVVGRILDEPHSSPDPRCSCGIFAYNCTRTEFMHYWALYLVMGWGRLGYGATSQWRAQYVQPIALSFYAPTKLTGGRKGLAEELAENYDIPIITHQQVPLFAELKGLSFEKPSQGELR